MGKRTAVWVEISCDNCGDLFEKKQSKLKYSKKHYCSLDCCDKHKKKTMKGKNNHRYGTKASKETNEKRSKSMKEQWKNQNYIDKILTARRKARELADYPFGWDPASVKKRTETLMMNYGAPHNWSNKECREKCEQTTIERHGRPSLEIAQEAITEEIIEKRRRTFIKTMTGISYEQYETKLGEKKTYYKRVRRLTERQPLHLLKNYEKRGHHTTSEDPYHLDHIIPISYGWLNGIPAEIIADLPNLRFIPAAENISKSSKYEGQVWRGNDEKIQN
jgi:hypothetical protein